MKKQEKQDFSSKKERWEWICKAKKEFWDFLKKRENRRRRKGKKIKQWPLKKAKKNFAKILFEKHFFSKKLQRRIKMIKENWKYFVAFYDIKNCPATNNAIENYYSTSLKTHRKKQFRTDRGSEFFANKEGRKKGKEHEFVRYLKTQNIKHIPSRVKNPQTNGKLERWHQEYEKHRPRFNTLPEFIQWVNNRIHGELRTRPNRAFINKLQPESLIGTLFK